MKLLTIAAASVLILSSCASVQEKVSDLKEEKVEKLFVDLKVAEKIADRQGDIISSTCYKELLKHIPKDEEKIQPVGPISRQQLVAGLLFKLKEGISDETRLACAAKWNRIKSIKMDLIGLLR